MGQFEEEYRPGGLRLWLADALTLLLCVLGLAVGIAMAWLAT